MPGRVIEVLTPGTRLTRKRGFAAINPPEKPTTQVPLSDISILIVSKGVQISTNLLLALQGNNATVMVTGENYHPASIFWPTEHHGSHCRRLEAQITASLPLQKRLWQKVVQVKISAQSEVLAEYNQNKDEGLAALAKKVKSGDPQK